MLVTILKSFSFIPRTASELIFLMFFHKFCLFVAMVSKQIKWLKQEWCVW